MKYPALLLALMFELLFLNSLGQSPWINEFHYDNVGSDTLEFVEVVIPNADSTLWSNLELSIYNGSTGKVTTASSISTWNAGDTINGFAYFYTWVKIQNGPEALCLSDTGAVHHLFFFESSFTLASGPAAGNVGAVLSVSESNATPVGQSLGLSGSGSAHSHFSWYSLGVATPGSPNSGQSTLDCSSPNSPTLRSTEHHTQGLRFEMDTQACSPYYILAGSSAGYPQITSPDIDSLGLSPLWGPSKQGTDIQYLDSSSRSFTSFNLPTDTLLYFSAITVNDFGWSAPLYFTKNWKTYDSLWISEIMYNPSGGVADEMVKEWGELYNASEDTVFLEGWQLASGTNTSIITGALSSIPPKHFLVLGLSSDTSQNGGTPVDIDYDSGVRLNNTSDSIELLDPLDKTHTIINYSSALGWPACPDGYSLEWNFLTSPYSATSWSASGKSGGSPGAFPYEFRYARNRWYPEIPKTHSLDTLWVGDGLDVDSLYVNSLTVYQDTLTVNPRGILSADSLWNEGVIWLQSSSLGSSMAKGVDYSSNGRVIWETTMDTAGWKMISVPLDDCDFSSLSSQVHLQYKDDPNGSNIQFWDAELGLWTSPKNENSPADSCGFLLYLDPNFVSNPTWPKTLQFTGSKWKSKPHSFPSHHNTGTQWGGGYNGQVIDGWALWGNPYPSQILWSEIKASLGSSLGSAYYVWNNSNPSWEFSDGSVSTPQLSDKIANGQAFFVRISDTTQPLWQIDTSFTQFDSVQISLKSLLNSEDCVSLVFDSAEVREYVFLKHSPGKAPSFYTDQDGVTPSNEWSLLLPNSVDSNACSIVSFDFNQPAEVGFRPHNHLGWTLSVLGAQGKNLWLIGKGNKNTFKQILLSDAVGLSLDSIQPQYISNYFILSHQENPQFISHSSGINSPVFSLDVMQYWVFSMDGKLVVSQGVSEKDSPVILPAQSGVYCIWAQLKTGELSSIPYLVP